MAYNILLTSLYEKHDRTVSYFFAKDGGKFKACDAMLTVEASAKYVLANDPIDEIVTIGRRLTYDEGDDRKLINLREGSSFYTSDINDLSAYSLFRYRIAQYIDELRIEQHDLSDLLTEEEQDRTIKFIRKFYQETGAEDEFRKFNRFFSELAEDQAYCGRFREALRKEIPEAAEDPVRYRDWVENYLYMELRDSYKLELLKGNENVKVRFIPTNLTEGGKLPIDNMLELVNAITAGHDEEVNLYVALNNDDQTDNFVLLNLIDIIDTLHGSQVTVKRILNTTGTDDGIAGWIRDDTVGFGITELVAAMRAFLQYGKVDMIVDYWERTGVRNEEVEKMIYAMRHIDFGVSLCKIAEIESGIEQLREIYAGGVNFGSDNYFCKLFTIIAEGIRLDYGPLLEGNETRFIDLVRWAFSKKFYQQTLTIIESKAPAMLVDTGLFYYCGSEAEKDHVLQIFAKERQELRPFEYWKMDDISHFFIKTYIRRGSTSKAEDPQRAYANLRLAGLDNTDPDTITALTCCDDREAVGNLLYAYYHIGEIRNRTNHADNRVDDGGRLIVDRKDVPYLMSWIREGIQYFLNSYDTAMELIRDKNPDVVKVTNDEVRACFNKMESSGQRPRRPKPAPAESTSEQKPETAKEKESSQ